MSDYSMELPPKDTINLLSTVIYLLHKQTYALQNIKMFNWLTDCENGVLEEMIWICVHYSVH